MRSVYALLDAIRTFLDDIAAIRRSVSAIATKKESGQQQPKVTIDLPSTINVKAEISEPDRIRQDKNTAENRRFSLNLGVQSAIAIGTLGAFIAGSYYACITRKMWKDVHEQSRTAQQQLELSQRPWIKIVDVKTTGESPFIGALSFQQVGPWKDMPDVHEQVTLQVTTVVENIGHSVAEINPAYRFFVPKFSTDKYWELVKTEERNFCESAGAKQADENSRSTIFPGDAPHELKGAAMSLIGGADYNYLPNDPHRYIVGSVIVCATYRLKGLPSVYQTRTVYTVVHTDGTRYFEVGTCGLHPFPQSPIVFCEGGVPASKLRLLRETQADDAY